jgi:pyruvate kinase
MDTRPLTKIVCTIGPSSSSRERLKELMLAGMSIARLNFSHGTEQEHLKTINLIKEVREELCMHVGIALDTRGPEIRVMLLDNMPAYENDILIFSTVPNSDAILITPVNLSYLKVGDRVFVDDGMLAMEVIEVQDDRFTCRCLNGHVIRNNKSINFPGVQLGLEALGERDRSDILFGKENSVDFIFASFISSASDVEAIRELVEGALPIVSKIETLNAMKNLREIVGASDGIMAARGDLGAEVGLGNLFEAQKVIFKACREGRKPLICATEMMQSMVSRATPTRAEISDVGNAVVDGCDCVMLSGETASGRFPVETVRFISRICMSAEEHLRDEGSAGSGCCTICVVHYASSYDEAVSFAPGSLKIIVSEDRRLLRRMSIHRGVIPTSAYTNISVSDIKDRLGLKSDVLVSESFMRYSNSEGQ